MQTKLNGTVGVYVRVSTLEQAEEGYSIAAQKERLKSYCEAQGWQDFKFYVDEGISAKDMNRPQLQLLFEHIKEGKISLILVYRLDRFTRSVRDLHKMLEMMETYKCGFRSATEVYDTTSAMGRLFITIVAALAEWESDNSSERIKMALEKKVADGEWVGNVPYGFDLVEGDRLVKNEKSKVILEMIKLLKSGMSVTAIARHLTLTNDDRATWHPQGVFRLLKNPVIYGANRWVDKVFENTHEGIITKDEFLKIQELLMDRAIHFKRDVESTYLFQGVLVCPKCNSRLSVNRYFRKRKDGTGYQSALYRCQPCTRNGVLSESVGERNVLDGLYQYMSSFVIEQDELPAEDVDNEYANLLDQLNKIERKREKYQKGWAADLITDEEFSKLMNETAETYEYYKQAVTDYRPPVRLDVEEVRQTVIHFNENFKLLTTDEQRSFISEFVKEIHYRVVPQPPKDPRKHKNGRPQLIVTNVRFY